MSSAEAEFPGPRPLSWADLCMHARAAGTPDGALVSDERGRAVYATTPSIDGNRLNLRVTTAMTMALTWQQMRDYAGVRSLVEVWITLFPEPVPATGVRLETGSFGAAVLVIEGKAGR